MKTRFEKNQATRDSLIIKNILIFITIIFFIIFIFLPLFLVFLEAFKKGYDLYFQSVAEADALSAIKLTLLVTAIVVPLNVVFGVSTAWLVTKYDFKFKNVLMTLIDIPFSVSPVISGLAFILIFGAQGYLGLWLQKHDLKIIFALPGMILATLFVTAPFVARELIPLMINQGREEEEAATVLGANIWQVFWRVTLPNIKWGLLYGTLLCTARTIGEFGAVSVVSGHIRGLTNTIPLHVEILYNEYNFVAAFSVASLLAFIALVTLCFKSYFEKRLNND